MKTYPDRNSDNFFSPSTPHTNPDTRIYRSEYTRNQSLKKPPNSNVDSKGDGTRKRYRLLSTSRSNGDFLTT